MAQIKTKSSSVTHQLNVEKDISKLTKHLSLGQKSTVLRASRVLAELSSSERHAALDVLKQRNSNGGLDYRWLANFLTVLSKLKAG